VKARLVRFLQSAGFVALGLLSVAGGMVAADRAPQREPSPPILRAVRVVDGDGLLERIDVLVEGRWDSGLYAQMGMSIPTAASSRGSSVFLRAGVEGASDYVDLVLGQPARLLAATCAAGNGAR
jgi:hypothetical protein